MGKLLLRFGIYFTFFVLLANALFTSAIAASSPYPSATIVGGIWPNPNIPVCWENPSNDNAQERAWVRDAIATSWEAVSQVKFSGWAACPAQTSTSDGIRIQIDNQNPHVKALGRNLNGFRNGMVLNFELTGADWGNCTSNLEFCIRAIAIHEFGHALGLVHEQNREDSPPVCKAEQQGTAGNWYLTKYDEKSVMNYCNPNWNGNGQLSSGDIVGVQHLYGPNCGSWVAGDEHTVRLYAGQVPTAMAPINSGLLTAFSGGGIYLSTNGIRPGGGCQTTRVYLSSSIRVLAMVPFNGGVVTSFSNGGIYFSPDGQNPGGGGNTVRLYTGQSVRAMSKFRDGLVTAFSGGGIYYSKDGQFPGGGANTVRLYQGIPVSAITQHKDGLVTAFSDGSVYLSTDGKYPGGGANTTRTYNGPQVATKLAAFKTGLLSAFSGGDYYLSPNGLNPGGGGNTARIYSGQKVTSISQFRSGFVTGFLGGGIYYSPLSEFPGGFTTSP